MKAGSIIKSWNRGDGPRTGYYAEDQDDKVIFLRVNNLKNNTIELKNVKYIHRKIHETKLRRTQVTKGNVVFAISGTKNNLGTVSVIPNSIEEANLNSALVRLDLDDSIIDKYFFCILFSLPFIRKQIEFIGKGAAQNNLNSNEIASILIPNLSLEKQREIIDFYDLANQKKQEKEAEAKRLLESIDEYLLEKLGIELPQEKEAKKIFFTSLKTIQGKRLDPFYYSDKFDDLKTKTGKSNYEYVKLKEIATHINSGKTPATSSYSNTIKEFPIVKAGSYTQDEINLKKVGFSIKKQPYEISKYDIFILSAAHQAEYVGRQIKILMEKPDVQTSFVGELIRITTNDEKCNPIYLFTLLKLNYFKDLINREKTGQTSHIYSKDIKHIKIPLPPLEVQNEIANYILDLSSRAKELEREAKDILKSAKKEVEKMILGEE